MFIAVYNYPNSKEIFIGKVSIINYLVVALTSLKGSLRRHRLVIKPTKYINFPKNYNHYSLISADSRYTSIRWVAPWKVNNYFKTKKFLENYFLDTNF